VTCHGAGGGLSAVTSAVTWGVDDLFLLPQASATTVALPGEFAVFCAPTRAWGRPASVPQKLMAGIFLSSYFVNVRQFGSKADLPLAFKKGASVYKHVESILDELQHPQKHPTQSHVMQVTQLDRDGVDLWGLIDRGEYGYEAMGVNSDTFKPTYQRSVDDAEMVPLYFRFHLPDASSTGILVLQRLGVHGAFGDLRDAILSRFKDEHPDHRMEVGRFVPAKVMQELIDGQVREISVTTRQMSSDVADTVRLKGAQASIGAVEVRVRAQRGSGLLKTTPKWLKDLREGRVNVVQAFGDEAKKVRIRVAYKGHTRWYDLTRPDTIAPYLDVSDEVARTAGGHPVFEGIDTYAQGLRDELLDQIGQDAKN
jgi:hypothetical protein